MTDDSPTATPRRLNGRCICGTYRFAVDDDFQYALNCHCSLCRRATGSAFKPFGGIPREQLALTAGEPERLLIVGEPYGHDARCPQCGALLYSLVRDGAWFHVPYGSLVDAPTRRPQAHIFVGSKAPWFEITDGLPQHETYD